MTMVILGELLDILHDVTELKIFAYDEYKLQHKWIFGEGIKESIYEWYDRKNGMMSIIDRKINVHGNPKKNGTGESGWDVDKTDIPQAILDAPVWHILLSERGGRSPGGRRLFVYVEMPAMTAEMVKTSLAEIERPLLEEEYEQ